MPALGPRGVCTLAYERVYAGTTAGSGTDSNEPGFTLVSTTLNAVPSTTVHSCAANLTVDYTGGEFWYIDGANAQRHRLITATDTALDDVTTDAFPVAGANGAQVRIRNPMWHGLAATDISLQPESDLEEPSDARGGTERGAPLRGPQRAVARLGADADALTLAVLLKAILGHPSTVREASATLTDFTFTPFQTRPASRSTAAAIVVPGVTLGWTWEGSEGLRLRGGQATGFTLSLRTGEIVTAALELIGARVDLDQPGLGAYADLTPFRGWDAQYWIGGASRTDLLECQIRVSHPVEVLGTITNSAWSSQPHLSGPREWELECTVSGEDAQELADWVDDVDRSFRLLLSTSAGHRCDVQFPQVVLEEVRPGEDIGGHPTVSFTGRPVWNPATSQAASVIVRAPLGYV